MSYAELSVEFNSQSAYVIASYVYITFYDHWAVKGNRDWNQLLTIHEIFTHNYYKMKLYHMTTHNH